MNASARKGLSRRGMLAGGGALIVSFSLKNTGLAQQTGEAQNAGTAPARPASLPGSLDKTPMLDAWIRVDADGTISVFTGKAELGQGIKTALIQVAAEQLDVAPHSVHLVAADTARTPNEGYTAGSHSMQDSGTAIMHAAAQVREILMGIAAERLSLPIEQLAARDGAIVARDGRLIGYGELIIGDALHVRASPTSALKDPRPTGSSARQCRASTSRPRSRAGRPMCMTCACPAWCTRGSSAPQLWRAPVGGRYDFGGADARGREGHSRRQLYGGLGRTRV